MILHACMGLLLLDLGCSVLLLHTTTTWMVYPGLIWAIEIVYWA